MEVVERRSLRRPPRTLLAALVVLAMLVVGGCGGSDDDGDGGGSGSGTAEPIVFGLAVGTSGPIAAYDVPALDVLKNRVEQINAGGGVDGREIELLEGNTQSDPTVATNIATEFVDKGADVIFTSCDFDFGSPAATVAVGAGIPAVSLCAGDPKFADTTTLGREAFTFASGSDAEGSSIAEWAKDEKGWTTAYVLQDESIEYTKSVGRYFKARWEELGGEVVGEDSFPGGESVNIRSQVTKMAPDANGADFIVLPSWLPGAATAIKQIREAGVDTPIVTGAAVYGDLLFEIAGSVKDVYLVTLGCFEPICTDTPTPAMDEAAEEIAESSGQPPSTAAPLAADTAVRALAQAFELAGEGAEGSAVVDELQNMGEVETLAGPLVVATPTCNKPTSYPHYIVAADGKKFAFDSQWAVQEVPDLGEGNGCATAAE